MHVFKPKLPLRVFAAAIAQSISQANAMLGRDHLDALRQGAEESLAGLLPPPLLIQNVRVKFRGDVSKSELHKEPGELCIDLSKPEGNFSAELEFIPFDETLLGQMNSPEPQSPPQEAAGLSAKPREEEPLCPRYNHHEV